MNILKTNYLRGVNISSGFIGKLPSVSGTLNPGCHLYIGESSASNSLTVKNLSGDEVSFKNVLQGTVLPFAVTEITSSSDVGSLVALW
jgi:hypothetical protein